MQSSVNVTQIHFPIVTYIVTFLEDILRLAMFTPVAKLALIKVILLLENNASSTHFDTEKCEGAMLSS